MVRLIFCVLTLFLLLGSVSAYDAICDFNGSVHLNKSDLLPYASDQSGCMLQKMQDGSGLLIVSFFVLIILVFIYSLARRKL